MNQKKLCLLSKIIVVGSRLGPMTSNDRLLAPNNDAKYEFQLLQQALNAISNYWLLLQCPYHYCDKGSY